MILNFSWYPIEYYPMQTLWWYGMLGHAHTFPPNKHQNINWTNAYVSLGRKTILILLTYREFSLPAEISLVHDDVMTWDHFPSYWPFPKGKKGGLWNGLRLSDPSGRPAHNSTTTGPIHSKSSSLELSQPLDVRRYGHFPTGAHGRTHGRNHWNENVILTKF